MEHRGGVRESATLAAAALPPLEGRPLRLEELHGPVLSTLQVETAMYAAKALRERGAFLLADATGMGKTRTICAAIRETGARRVLWITLNSRLQADAQAELRQVGAKARLTSYSQVRSAAGFDELRAWLAGGDSLLVLDEAHSCRNRTHTAHYACALGRAAGGVLYSTATVGCAAKQLAYLERLGLWGGAPFRNFAEFAAVIQTQEALELVCAELKAQGMFVARQLGLDGVRVEYADARLSEEEEALYNRCCEALRPMQEGHEKQAFFRRLITRFKVRHAVAAGRAALERGESAIFSLQSTGEAACARGGDACGSVLARFGASVAVPGEPLKALLAAFEGDVVEISGRTARAHAEGRRAFQAGEKRVAIITRAGSAGISLHDTCHRRRFHVVVELPWSASDYVQQCGRSHRTNQMSAPTYCILRSSVPGEVRFVQSVARRLCALGALSSGETAVSPSAGEPNEWSVAARRAACAELWVRAHAETGLRQPLPPVPTPFSRAERHLFSELCRREAGDLVLSADLSALARATYPAAATWSGETRWEPERAHRFPRSVQDCLLALYCAHARGDHFLSRLPACVLDLIAAEYARDPWGMDARAAVSELDRVGLSLTALGSGTAEFVQNRLLLLPLSIQRGAHSLLVAHARERAGPPSGIRLLSDVVRARGVRGYECRRAEFGLLSGRSVLRLHLRPVVDDPPPAGEEFFLDRRCRRLCTSSGGTLAYSDGRRAPLTASKRADLVPSTAEAWRAAHARATATAAERRRANARVCAVATSDLLSVWFPGTTSAVRVDADLVREHGIAEFVGVLL